MYEQKIIVVKKKEPVKQSGITLADKFAGTIYGIFGTVKEQFIKIAKVSVKLDNGIVLHYVSVPSMEWESGDGVGETNLPPVGSRVFVFLPYGQNNMSGCMILNSPVDTDNDTDRLSEGDEDKHQVLRKGGIKTVYDRSTGNYTITDKDDSKLLIELNKEEKILSISDWNNNNITLNSDKIEITNTESGGTITINSSGKIVIKNTLYSLRTLIDELITILTSLTTFGSPVSHTISPSVVTQLTALKVKIDALMEAS